MTTFNQAFPGGGGAGGTLGGWALPILTSKTLTFPVAGKVQIGVVAATGSGGSGAYSTGANSSPIGVKVLEVSAANTIEFTLGAAGAPKTNGTGNVGANTVVKHNGVTIMTAQPGEPGQFGAAVTVNPAAATATVTGADRVIPGLQSQPASNASCPQKGGAAVNVFSTGLGRGASGDALTGGSVGVDTTTAPTAPLPLTSSELGVTFLGLDTAGLAGVGGNNAQPGGLFAGGGANAKGGLGAGGGGSLAGNPSGAGGAAYAYVVFVPSE